MSAAPRVVAYLTQYGFWWSVTLSQWERLYAVAVRGDGYELQLPYAKPLSGRPSSVRTSTDSRSGRRSYWAAVPVIRPLDYDATDWRYADQEVREAIELHARLAR